MSSAITKNLKTAIFSALLVLAVVFFVALTQLYTESAGLLGGLQMLVELYDKL